MQGRQKACQKQANGRGVWANSLSSYLFLWAVVTSAQSAKTRERSPETCSLNYVHRNMPTEIFSQKYFHRNICTEIITQKYFHVKYFHKENYPETFFTEIFPQKYSHKKNTNIFPQKYFHKHVVTKIFPQNMFPANPLISRPQRGQTNIGDFFA